MDTECALKTPSDRGSHMAELGLPDEAVQAFLWLFDDLIYSYTVKAEGDTVVFELDESYAYKRSLILHNCAPLDTEDYQTLDFCESEIIKNGDRYEFTAIAEDYETDKGKEIIISFDNAEVHVDLYRADARPFFFSPWDTVSLIASDIVEKSV